MRERRTGGRLSQLDLALRAGTTPYPAIIIDRHGGLIGTNDAFGILSEGAADGLLGPGANAYRLALHPAGMAPRIVNFAQWARHVLDGLQHEASRHPDEQLSALHAELSQYVPDQSTGPGHPGFAVPLHLRSGAGELRLMTTISSFATAVDVTVAELKLEAFLPADEAPAAALLSQQGRGPGRPGQRGGQ